MPDQENDNKGISNQQPPPVNPLTSWCKKVKKKYEDAWWLVGVIVGIVGIAVGVAGANWLILGPRVEEAAKKVVLSQQVLSDISSRLRPYAVIDARLNNSSPFFEYDQGVGDVIESVDFREGETNLSAVLTFKMKKFVRLPLVTPLASGIYVHSFWQTNKFDWAFEIRPSPTTEKFQGVDTDALEQGVSAEKDYRFLVELLVK